MKPIVLTIGDPNGIGPEVLLKTVAQWDSDQPFLIVGPYRTVQWWNRHLQLDLPMHVWGHGDDQQFRGVGIWDVTGVQGYEPEPGKVSKSAGHIAHEAINAAVRLCLEGVGRGLVTAPIHKEAFALAGAHHPGHTELLAELCGIPEKDVLMMLTDETLRIVPATIHVPLATVPALITEQGLVDLLARLNGHMDRLWGLKNARIHVLGLNPHAGDNGVLGTEEVRVITPAIRRAREMGVIVDGPFPADAYFGTRRWHNCDVVVAMYHDQGLIPIKMLSFDKGVNMTLGLPFVRTSPDHGTAFDIAGRNIANPSSFMHAVSLVNRITSH